MAAHQIAQMIEMERFAGIRNEQRSIIRFDRKPWPGLPDVFVEPRRGAVADRDHPVLLSLTLPDHDRAAFGVEIVHFQVGEFQPAYAG